MKKKAILEMLQELLRTAVISETDPDDISGCNTRYYVDQEQLMKNIETELDKCPVCNGLSTVNNLPCYKCHGYR